MKGCYFYLISLYWLDRMKTFYNNYLQNSVELFAGVANCSIIPNSFYIEQGNFHETLCVNIFFWEILFVAL